MKTKLLILCALFFFTSTTIMAQGGVGTELVKTTKTVETIKQNEEKAPKSAYGKAVSLDNKVSAMDKKIQKAKAKLAEHKKNGTLPADVIAKKEAQIAAFETKMNTQKAELATIKNTPKPGKGKGKQLEGKPDTRPTLDGKPVNGGDVKQLEGKPDTRPTLDGKPVKGGVKQLEGKPDTRPTLEGSTKGKDEIRDIKDPKGNMKKAEEIKKNADDKIKKKIEQAEKASKKGLDKAEKAKAKGLDKAEKAKGKSKIKDHK